MTITVLRSGTLITGDGQISLPDTDVVLIEELFAIFRTRIRIDRSQADLIVDATGEVVTPRSDL